ncbi:MAG: hypothetical protein K6F50_04980 [Kiritimatiellae bacterium]|nr:hypothetical protein [Kiritimatiellia bacterium]
MKKLIALAAVATCGAALAVESANIVGYNTTDLTTGKGKLSMVGGSFTSVSGAGFQMNGDMTVSNIKGGSGASDADTLLMWDPTKFGGAGGYTTFYYYDDGSEAGWCDPATDDYVEKSDTYKNGFPAGSAFWFNAIDTATKTITFSGAIEDADYVEAPLANGKQLSMIANAYPVALKLNDSTNVAFTGLKGGSGASDSDTLLMWDSSKFGGAGGYTTFYYYDDGSEKGWCDPATDDWVENSDAYKNGLPAGMGLWFNPLSATSHTIQFKKPL